MSSLLGGLQGADPTELCGVGSKHVFVYGKQLGDQGNLAPWLGNQIAVGKLLTELDETR